MPEDKKGGLALVLGPPEGGEEDDGEADMHAAKKDAAKRVMKAAKSDDTEAFTEALTEFVELCTTAGYDDEGEA